MALIHEVRERIRVLNLSGSFSLEASEGFCSERHRIIVIREQGKADGGLVVYHEDPTYSLNGVRKVLDLMDEVFINQMIRIGVFKIPIWSYAKINTEGTAIDVLRPPLWLLALLTMQMLWLRFRQIIGM